MLADALRQEIRAAFFTLTEAKDLKPRWGQRQMIAEVANAFGDPETSPFLAIEAGTGTGKTIAYIVAALPVAKAQSKKLIIATATVALQEQLIFKDLPEIKRHSGIDFTYQLAKGRSRYLCLYKLDQLIQGYAESSMLSMYPDEVELPEGEEVQRTYDAMLTAVSDDSWDGDLDAWPEALDVGVIRSITTDHSQCLGRRCPHITGCSFFRAREGLEETDIIVTNHDLVLADFRLGGGRILSEPEESFYIFDEGHQLAEKCLEHFACFSRSGRTYNNLAETQQWLDAKRELLIEYEVRPEALSALSISTDDLIQASRDTYALCWNALSGRADDRADLRFPFGVVDGELRDASRSLRDLWRLHRQKLSPILGLIEALVEEGDADQREIWESNLNDLQVILARAEGQIALWDSYASSDEESSTPWARWMRHYGDESSIECYASPIYARDILSEHVWERVAGAVMTSATLTALGSFDHLMQQTGLPSDTTLARVESPFDASRGRFVVPDMATDPSEPAAHSDELINLFPSLLERHRGTLVLFSSKRQLQELVEALEPVYESRLLVQGQMSKAEILQEHRRRIDRGDPSIIFGLASFAEGVDLPGDYCSHVIIAKLPFAAPDDPIDAAHAELLEAAGRNPFMELTVPSASLRLLQACGRLLRTETDEGVITLLDRRIVTKRYGRAIMDALPRYQFQLTSNEASRPPFP